jgi:hypothetical protein
VLRLLGPSGRTVRLRDASISWGMRDDYSEPGCLQAGKVFLPLLYALNYGHLLFVDFPLGTQIVPNDKQ